MILGLFALLGRRSRSDNGHGATPGGVSDQLVADALSSRVWRSGGIEGLVRLMVRKNGHFSHATLVVPCEAQS